MGKTEQGAVWLDKKMLSLMTTGNSGEIQMIEMSLNFLKCLQI